MSLTVEELQFLMELISARYGFGYSDIRAVGQLQAKLSIMSEVSRDLNRHSPEPFPAVDRTSADPATKRRA